MIQTSDTMMILTKLSKNIPHRHHDMSCLISLADNELKSLYLYSIKIRNSHGFTSSVAIIYPTKIWTEFWCDFLWLSHPFCADSHVENCPYSLRWRHNGHDSVSNHQPHDCLLNRLFRRRSKKTSKLRVTGLCVGNSPGTGEFPAQMGSNAENVSIWWRHHVPPVPVK